MPENEYVPTGPYFFKSGIRKGVSLEEMMFKDYFWLACMRNKMNAGLKSGSKMNAMHMHLLWLLDRGEDRVSPVICPYCNEKHISFFAYSYKEGKYYTCCDSWYTCVGQVLAKAERFPLQFSSITRLSWSSRKYASAFLKSVFLPGSKDPTAQQLFEFFRAPSPGK